jgi:hypothetical protein
MTGALLLLALLVLGPGRAAAAGGAYQLEATPESSTALFHQW